MASQPMTRERIMRPVRSSTARRPVQRAVPPAPAPAVTPAVTAPAPLPPEQAQPPAPERAPLQMKAPVEPVGTPEQVEQSTFQERIQRQRELKRQDARNARIERRPANSRQRFERSQPDPVNEAELALYPPEVVQAEMSALGAMMLRGKNTVLTRGMKRLRGGHFRLNMSRFTFQAICRVVAAARKGLYPGMNELDIVCVAEELRRMGRLDDGSKREGMVPASFLTLCVEACPSELNIDAYIDIVIEVSKLRQLHFAGNELARFAMENAAMSAPIITAYKQILEMIEAGEVPDVCAIFEQAAEKHEAELVAAIDAAAGIENDRL